MAVVAAELLEDENMDVQIFGNYTMSQRFVILLIIVMVIIIMIVVVAITVIFLINIFMIYKIKQRTTKRLQR